MRGIPGMVTETSDLDANTGITYRGYTLKQCNDLLPKAKNDGGECGLPEASFWLLLTGQIPTEQQVEALNAELRTRQAIPTHVMETLKSVRRGRLIVFKRRGILLTYW
jgi:citrate synthase